MKYLILFVLITTKALAADECEVSSQWVWPFQSQVTLYPGQNILKEVPKEFHKKSVAFMILGHHQNPATDTGRDASGRDSVPGLTSIQIQNEYGEWRYWGGPSSGANGAKFAEPRFDLEMENLYDWKSYGHCALNSSACITTPLFPHKIRLENVGTDPVQIGHFSIKFFPESYSTQTEQIFSPGTTFNHEVGGHAQWSEGQKSMGLFPNAKALRYQDLVINLPAGKKLVFVEVIGGDSHPDQITNKDGGWGTPGWARISIGKGTSDIKWFVKNENVPPEGMMMGAPSTCYENILPGEKLVIRAQSDTLYIMGYRLTFL